MPHRRSTAPGALRSRRHSSAARLKGEHAELMAALRNLIDSLAQTVQINQFISQTSAVWPPQPLGRWPLEADTLGRLVHEVSIRRHEAVIEFGSGASTVAIGKALALAYGDRAAGRHIAFEHHPDFHRLTAAALSAMGLTRVTQLLLSPLVQLARNPEPFGSQPYYDCGQALQDFLSALPADTENLLVLVDGPPGSTCPKARYPALPEVCARTRHLNVSYLLDDASRQDETEILRHWRRHLTSHQIRHTVETWKSQKGVVKITVPAAEI